MEKNRLDLFLVNNNLAKSRNFAQNLIINQKVKVNNQIIVKPNYLINPKDKVELIQTISYVSRGAYKLKAAIDNFQINLNNLIAVDIGASTGGFSQVMLENNIKKIYAIDVGTNQLDKQIKENQKVINLEKTNFKNFDKNLIKEKIDFICIDVSFISVFLIIKKIIELNWKDWKAVVLLKPQFEIGKKISKTKGYAKKSDHYKIIENFKQLISSLNIKNLGYIESPIKGAKKENTEYLFYLEYPYGK